MKRDLRENELYQDAERLYRALRQPETGQISDATDLSASPDGNQAVFAGVLVDKLEGVPQTRVCHVDLRSGAIRVLTFGPNFDRLPKFAPDGRKVAFLSDRKTLGDFQLYLLDPLSAAARPAPHVDGWIEYLHWSPDGARILLGVAGHGADISGGQGAVTTGTIDKAPLSWMPTVKASTESHQWRRLWIYEIATDRVCALVTNANVWEATWCGDDVVAAVMSPSPSEGSWYSARLHMINIESGDCHEVFRPHDQIGWPSGSPSGKYLAVVEAISSDRWLVAGNLRSIETRSGEVQEVNTAGVDVTCISWLSERHLLVAGHRGFESVVGLYDVVSKAFREIWASSDLSTGGRYISVSGLNETGDCLLIGESFLQAPAIAAIRDGKFQQVKSFDLGYADEVRTILAAEPLTWTAPDGLSIQGWLLRPKGPPPHPLVMYVHGGPVWLWRPRWLGRLSLDVLMLLTRGYAIFYPNPRGSAGRGQPFARRVVGDMGGADTFDYLSGLDYLVERGLADASRLGVTGGSYGGFMTSWLITQDRRFAAAVSLAPVANQVSQHLTCNIPEFVALFLQDTFLNPGGKYFERSPIMHAHKTRTPTLNICGALDRCTPPEEALQFHSALVENGVESVLVTYPEEGHGVRRLPTLFDYAARVVHWFTQHMPVQLQRSVGSEAESLRRECSAS